MNRNAADGHIQAHGITGDAFQRPLASDGARFPGAALAALGVVTHPVLDWLNNYGMRWLMPFDGRWFYGDALFIIDPWVWLVLGGSLFLMHARRLRSRGRHARDFGTDRLGAPAVVVDDDLEPQYVN